MEILPTVPDLDSSSSDGSVDDDDDDDNNNNNENNDEYLDVESDDGDNNVIIDEDDDQNNNTNETSTATAGTSPTTLKSIKPGGEDNEPVPPTRSISPVYSRSSSTGDNKESSSTTTQQRRTSKQQQQKASTAIPTRLANPLDAFDKSPENNSKPTRNTINSHGGEVDHDKEQAQNNNNEPMNAAKGSAINRKEATLPGLGGPPLTNSNNKNTSSNAGKSLTLRRMPQRSNLKKASSFNVGDKKQHLRSALQQMSRSTQNNKSNENDEINSSNSKNENGDESTTTTGDKTTSNAAVDASESKQSFRRGEPTRGVLRCSSMPVRARKPTMIEVRVRGERFPVQRHRHINFHQRVEIKEVEPVPEMVDGNCSDIWLQEEDFVKMKQDRKNVVKQIKKQQLLQQQQQQQQDDSSASNHSAPQPQQNNYRPGQQPQLSPEQASTLRGLEKYVDKSIRAAKNMAWDTVLLEQDEQELSGDYNDERIADLYKHTTRESPNKAMTRAKQDEQEIQDYLWSPRTTKLLLRHKQVASPRTSNNSAAAAAAAAATVGTKKEGSIAPSLAPDISSTEDEGEAAADKAAPMAAPMMSEPAAATNTDTASPSSNTTAATSSAATAITAPEAVPPMVRS